MSPGGGLIGRDAELAVLLAMITGIDDNGGAVVLRGEPGVGKSSILKEVATTARSRGLCVLEASGVESDAMPPFGGLLQLLRPLIPRCGELPTVQRHALSTALGAREGPPPELYLTALATLTLVVDVGASQPVVLVVDDVQWLDAPTIDVLAFVARRLHHDAVLLVAAVREGSAPGPGWADARELTVQGLDATSARALLATVADGLTAVDRRTLLTQAQGNPLALVELPAAWRSADLDTRTSSFTAVPLTARLERAFAIRSAELPPVSRDALLVAAVDAEDTLAEVLSAATAFSGVEVTPEDLEPAVKARLVEFDEATIRFRHPLVRSAVLLNEPVSRRQAAHAAMSTVLSAEPYRQVWHQAQSVDGPSDAIAERLDHSSLDSVRRGSVVSAIEALERSAELTSAASVRARRLLRAAQLAFGLGRVDLVSRLVDTAEAQGLCEAERARAEWLRELFSEGRLGDSARVRELCVLAARAASSGETDLALDLLASAALRCWWAVGDAADRSHVAGVAKTLTAVQDDPRCISVIAVADPLGEVVSTKRRLEAIAAAGVSDPEQLRRLGAAARAIGADALAADYFHAAETALRRQGQLGLLSQVLPVQAAVYLDLGNWARAGQGLEEARLLSQETGQTTWHIGTAAVEAVYEALTGQADFALRHAAEIEAECAGEVAGDFRSLVQLARGVAHLSCGRHADAYAALVPIFDPLGPCHHPREQLSAVMFLVEAAVGCGAEQAARMLIDQLEALARSTGSPILDVHLLYARAMLASDNAETLFKHALGQDLTRWPWPRARIELGYGNWLRQRRRPADARNPLRSALATFDSLGASGWASQARTALRAAGERTSAVSAESPIATMTPQEMQIARLAAEGMSNREIGQQLYLSPRTVGSHLYRIFPKLGITSRTQLSSRMAGS